MMKKKQVKIVVLLLLLTALFICCWYLWNRPRVSSEEWGEAADPPEGGALLLEHDGSGFQVLGYPNGSETQQLVVSWKDRVYFLDDNFPLDSGQLWAESLDCDGDKVLEEILIVRFYDNQAEETQNRLYVFWNHKGKAYWKRYDPAVDAQNNFADYVETELDLEKEAYSIIWKDSGQELRSGIYSGYAFEYEEGTPNGIRLSPSQITIEQGGLYLTAAICLQAETSEAWLPFYAKFRIHCQDKEPYFTLGQAEQLDLIAESPDHTVAVYGTEPEVTYQDMLLRADGKSYELDVPSWHTSYGSGEMAQADYDGDGQIETAFSYPYGAGSFPAEGLLVIEKKDNGEAVWTDVFPLDSMIDDSLENKCSALLGWEFDEEQMQVRIFDRETGKEFIRTSCDSEGNPIRDTFRGVYFSGNNTFLFEDGKIYMVCEPAISYEDQVSLCPLDISIRLEVNYQEGKEGELSMPEQPEESELPAGEDFYRVATDIPASEVEAYARYIRECFLTHDWASIADEISYPITIADITYADKEEFLEASSDFAQSLSEDFFAGLENEDCNRMFCNWSGIMMGATGEIWIADLLDSELNPLGLKITAVNAH